MTLLLNRERSGNTILHRRVLNGRHERLNQDYTPYINVKNMHGETPVLAAILHSATPGSRLKSLQWLIESGADMAARDATFERNALVWAVFLKLPQEARLLVPEACVSFNVSDADVFGRTALHYAVLHDNAGMVRALSRVHAKYMLSPDVKDTYGLTPLMLASLLNLQECERILLREGGSSWMQTISPIVCDVKGVWTGTDKRLFHLHGTEPCTGPRQAQTVLRRMQYINLLSRSLTNFPTIEENPSPEKDGLKGGQITASIGKTEKRSKSHTREKQLHMTENQSVVTRLMFKSYGRNLKSKQQKRPHHVPPIEQETAETFAFNTNDTEVRNTNNALTSVRKQVIPTRSRDIEDRLGVHYVPLRSTQNSFHSMRILLDILADQSLDPHRKPKMKEAKMSQKQRGNSKRESISIGALSKVSRFAAKLLVKKKTEPKQ